MKDLTPTLVTPTLDPNPVARQVSCFIVRVMILGNTDAPESGPLFLPGRGYGCG
jgi:hypothetical protein